MRDKLKLKISYLEILLFVLAISFSLFLMFFTFYKDNGSLFIASKAWSDFGSHIPLIRSFSFGSNFPPEYPLFPGQPINYHFLFYLIVGLLEKTGIPIDYALNIPSAIGFSSLILSIYYLAKKIFKSTAVGIVSIIFFLFNSSFSFIYFLQNHKYSQNLFSDLITNDRFSSFAPYGDGIVTAFWNLNIYTNQRHLALSFSISLLIIYFIFRPVLSNSRADNRVFYFLGIILGLSFYLHIAVFFMTVVVITMTFLLFPTLRKSILVLLIPCFLISLPQYLYLQGGEGTYSLKLVNGFLSSAESLSSFAKFWIYNIGVAALLIPLGFIVSPKNVRKIFLCFIPFFFIGNFVQFSPEIAANHKFFNYFLLIGNMFSAFFLIFLWKKNALLKAVSIFLLLSMTLGGIVDFFPIFNDSRGPLADYEKSKVISFFKNNTPPDSVVINSHFFYNKASLAGRKIYLGWPYFSWSQGYDTTKRDSEIKKFFSYKNTGDICSFLNKNRIDYIYLEEVSNDYEYDKSVWGKFIPVYKSSDGNSKVYETRIICSKN